ncbi:hypothetical protein T484DRAFT_1905262, partial [Baffinella frigidus]
AGGAGRLSTGGAGGSWWKLRCRVTTHAPSRSRTLSRWWAKRWTRCCSRARACAPSSRCETSRHRAFSRCRVPGSGGASQRRATDSRRPWRAPDSSSSATGASGRCTSRRQPHIRASTPPSSSSRPSAGPRAPHPNFSSGNSRRRGRCSGRRGLPPRVEKGLPSRVERAGQLEPFLNRL